MAVTTKGEKFKGGRKKNPVIKMNKGGSIKPVWEMDYTERREYIDRDIVPEIKEATMMFMLNNGELNYDFNEDSEDVRSQIDRYYREKADYTEEELERNTRYKLDGWELVRRDYEDGKIIEEEELEELSSDNTTNWSYNGVMDLNIRLYYDQESEKFFYVLHPHLGGDPRGNYGKAYILEGDDREDLFERFYDDFISGTGIINVKFDDGSSVNFESEQDADGWLFRVEEVESGGRNYATLLVNDFEGFSDSDADEFLTEIVDRFEASKKPVVKKSEGGDVSDDDAPQAYIKIEGYPDGQWMALEDYSDGDEFINGIVDWMEELNNEDGGSRQEWSVRDWRGFMSNHYSIDNIKNTKLSESDFDEVYSAYSAYEASDFPLEVIEEYMSDMSISDMEDAIRSMDDNYQGAYNDMSELAEQMVDEAIYTPSANQMYVTETDIRLISGEEADSRVYDMSFEDLLEEGNMKDEYDERLSKLEEELSELEDRQSTLEEQLTDAEGEDYDVIAQTIVEVEEEVDEKQAEIDNLPDEMESEVKEAARESISTEVKDRLENNLEDFLSEYGYENYAEVSFVRIDYDAIGRDLASDYTIIKHDGQEYVFLVHAKGGSVLNAGASKIKKYYVIEMNAKKIIEGFNDKKKADERKIELTKTHPKSRFSVYTNDTIASKYKLKPENKSHWLSLREIDKSGKVAIRRVKRGSLSTDASKKWAELKLELARLRTRLRTALKKEKKAIQADIRSIKYDLNKIKNKHYLETGTMAIGGAVRSGAEKVGRGAKKTGSWFGKQWRDADFGDGKGKAKFEKGGDTEIELIRILKDSGFNSHNGIPSNQYKHNRGHVVATVGKDNMGSNVLLENYTPDTHEFISSTMFDNPEKLSLYLDEKLVKDLRKKSDKGDHEAEMLIEFIDSKKSQGGSTYASGVDNEYVVTVDDSKTPIATFKTNLSSTTPEFNEIVEKSVLEQTKGEIKPKTLYSESKGYSYVGRKEGSRMPFTLNVDYKRSKSGSIYAGGGEISFGASMALNEAEKMEQQGRLINTNEVDEYDEDNSETVYSLISFYSDQFPEDEEEIESVLMEKYPKHFSKGGSTYQGGGEIEVDVFFDENGNPKGVWKKGMGRGVGKKTITVPLNDWNSGKIDKDSVGKYLGTTYAVGGKITSQGLYFSKIDYNVNINPQNLEVDVNIKHADTVNLSALSDTNVNWDQHYWGYMVYPKNITQLYEVLKALNCKVSKSRLEEWDKTGRSTYEDGGEITDNEYADYLNETIQPDYESDEWIIGGENRVEEYYDRYGDALKDHDPIAFEVGRSDYEREQYKDGGKIKNISPKFTKEETKILTEIYRRLNYFHDGDLNTNLLLLALPSEVKKIKKYNLVRPSSTEIPKVLNWYKLTKEGKIFFSHYVTKQKLSSDSNTKYFDQNNLKEFDKKLLTTTTKEKGGSTYADGGETWIQDATKSMEEHGTVGAFTKQAKDHGMKPVAFAKEVLANPDKFSEKTRERAQFVKNTNPEKFEEGGGVLDDNTLSTGKKLDNYTAVAIAEGFEHANSRDTIKAWAYIQRNGLDSGLQVWFGKTINGMIDTGYMNQSGDINWDKVNSDIERREQISKDEARERKEEEDNNSLAKRYKFEELSEQVQQTVLETLSDLNLGQDWWKNVYEDAGNVDYKITEFNLDQERILYGDFIHNANDTASAIIENHDSETNTYKIAKEYSDKYDELKTQLESLNEGSDNYYGLSGEIEVEMEELQEEFQSTLNSAYLKMLKEEYEYKISEEAIKETIIANNYEFNEYGTQM